MMGYDSMNISRFDDPSWYLPEDEVEERDLLDLSDEAYDEERERRSE